VVLLDDGKTGEERQKLPEGDLNELDGDGMRESIAVVISVRVQRLVKCRYTDV
jgi:hypothetical protein